MVSGNLDAEVPTWAVKRSLWLAWKWKHLSVDDTTWLKSSKHIYLHILNGDTVTWLTRVLCFSICSLLKLVVSDHSGECWLPLKQAVISKGRAKKFGVYFWSQCPLLRSCEGSIVLHFRRMKLHSLGQRCRQCSMGTRLPACLEARVRCSRPSALRL